MARSRGRGGRGRTALVRRGRRAGGALRRRALGGSAVAAAGGACPLSGVARCVDGGPRGPPALRPPPPPANLGAAGGPPAARGLHDPGRAERGGLAAGSCGRSLDEPPHARGLRPAASGASHWALRPRLRSMLRRAGGLSHAGAAHRGHADHPGALAPASRCLAAERLRGCGGAAHHRAHATRLVGGPGPAGRAFRPPACAGAGAAGCGAAQAALGHAHRDLDRRPLFHLCAGHFATEGPRSRRRGPERGGARQHHPPDSGRLRARAPGHVARRMPRSDCWRSAGSSSRRPARAPACSPSGGRDSSASPAGSSTPNGRADPRSSRSRPR